MAPKNIKIALFNFWEGFQIEHLNQYFPSLSAKYRFIQDQRQPDLAVFSVFTGGGWPWTMPAPPDLGVPTLFLTGENTTPDMDKCDYAISFRRDIDSPNHMRIPNWVRVMNLRGRHPRTLLSAQREAATDRDKFCLFMYRNQVALRENFFRILSSRSPVEAPGKSMNNAPAIGFDWAEQMAHMGRFRFTIAFENEATPGYTTEKLANAFIAGTVPIYWGDPLVGLDFNKDALLDLADFASQEELADAVMAIESDPAAWRRLRSQPVYAGDRVPDCADDERIFAFWERVLDPISQGRKAADPVAARIAADFEKAKQDTGAIGFHGDRHLVHAFGRALKDADLLVETGSNEGVSLAYAASLRPDIAMRSCELSPPALAKARGRCAAYPLVRIDAVPSPDSLFAVAKEFPNVAGQRPVFWLDAHAEGVPLPLAREVSFLTSTYPRGHLFIDDFQIPDCPWFGYDSYEDGTIGLDYVLPHLDRRHSYILTLPRYQEKSSTHHPLRGWCCISWNCDLGLEDEALYQKIALPAQLKAAPADAASRRLMEWLNYGSYVDPARRIVYVETPKAGCSSIKHLLRSLVTDAPVAFNPMAPETRAEMLIHDRGQMPLLPIMAFQGEALRDVLQGPGWFRFCVLRDPCERFFSAWRDKVFLCEPGFERYVAADGRRYVEFADFYHQVMQDEDPLSCNVHWRAQTELLLPDEIKYTKLYRLNELSALPADLSAHLAAIGAEPDMPEFRRMNEGFQVRPDGFLTPEIIAGLRRFYHADYQRFEFPDMAISFAERRSASELVNQFTDGIFERNRIISLYADWAKRR
jgi:hypothetical protein